MSQMTSNTAQDRFSYYDLIASHIREVVSKDTRFVCPDCGRLRNRNLEQLSGTLCPSCNSYLTVDPVINKFTTLVNNFQINIDHGVDKNLEDVTTKPTKHCEKKIENPINTDKISNQSIQTDLSFSPFEDVSFVINKKKDERDVIPKIFEKEIGEEVEILKNNDINCSNSVAFEALVDDCSTVPCEMNSPSKNSDIPKSENVSKILSKNQEKVIEMDTEVIESSVDDFLLPRKINSSPLLFSQETKEMGDPSEEYSDPDECVHATPPKDFESTCNWRKEDKSKSKSITVSDEESETGVQGAQVKCKSGNYEKQNKKCEFEESLVKNVLEPMEVDENPIKQCQEKFVKNENIDSTYCGNISSTTQNSKVKKLKLTEEQLLTQSTQRISKHNLKIVISSIEGDETKCLEEFIELYNPVIDSDVNQQTDFLVVGVDKENKVLKRTPKFLKAISLHVCIVNTDYLEQCCQQKDIVNLEKKFMPLDSSGSNGPIRSYIHQVNLLDGFVFFSIEKDPYLSTLLEFLIIQNGGIIIPDIKLFSAYDYNKNVASSPETYDISSKSRIHYTKIFMYGDNEEIQITPAYKEKVYSVFKCHSLNYKNLFNCVASYDTAELRINM